MDSQRTTGPVDLEAHLTEFISNDLLDGGAAVSVDEPLLADGLVDSLGMMRLVAFIDDSLGVEIPPEDVVLENFSTVSRIARYLRRKGV